jgi:hypothetical protein
MKVRKIFAMIGATGGMTIGLIGVVPLTAEAALTQN